MRINEELKSTTYMAERRMIRKDLWDDDRFNALTVHARLLFIALITCADDEGCFRADGAYWRRRVFHSIRIGAGAVNKMLESISEMDLIVVGQAKKGIAGYIPSWHQMQSLRDDRSKPSEYSDLLVANGVSPRFPSAAQGKRSEDKKIKENVSEDNIYSDNRKKMIDAMKTHTNNFDGLFPPEG